MNSFLKFKTDFQNIKKYYFMWCEIPDTTNVEGVCQFWKEHEYISD